MDKEAKSGCVWAIVLMLISPLSAVWKGYVGSVLWGWFVAPTFHLPTLTIPVAIGITYVFSALTPYQINDCTQEERSVTAKALRAMGAAILAPLFTLIAGWIVRGFL